MRDIQERFSLVTNPERWEMWIKESKGEGETHWYRFSGDTEISSFLNGINSLKRHCQKEKKVIGSISMIKGSMGKLSEMSFRGTNWSDDRRANFVIQRTIAQKDKIEPQVQVEYYEVEGLDVGRETKDEEVKIPKKEELHSESLEAF